MATGYTAGVADGTVTTFREYALTCARSFGATITLRDEPLSADIPEFKVGNYAVERVERARADLQALLAMTPEQMDAAAESEYQGELRRRQESLERKAELRRRYESMLRKAEQFVPPTAEHAEYARFLVSQIEESIKWDCTDSLPTNRPARLSWQKWFARRSTELDLEVQRSEKALREEVDRVRERNEWVRQLREAIDAVEPPDSVAE